MCDIMKDKPSNRRWLWLVVFSVYLGGLTGLPPKMAEAIVVATLIVFGSWLAAFLFRNKPVRQYQEW